MISGMQLILNKLLRTRCLRYWETVSQIPLTATETTDTKKKSIARSVLKANRNEITIYQTDLCSVQRNQNISQLVMDR